MCHKRLPLTSGLKTEIWLIGPTPRPRSFFTVPNVRHAQRNQGISRYIDLLWILGAGIYVLVIILRSRKSKLFELLQVVETRQLLVSTSIKQRKKTVFTMKSLTDVVSFVYSIRKEMYKCAIPKLLGGPIERRTASKENCMQNFDLLLDYLTWTREMLSLSIHASRLLHCDQKLTEPFAYIGIALLINVIST